MNGTHHPKTKKKLSELEKELLEVLLDVTDNSDYITALTSRQISEIMEWDIRQTTSTLSNLVGMDLLTESPGKSKMTDESKGTFSSNEPEYFIPKTSLIQKRAVYALERAKNDLTLFDILKGKTDFGENLWPFRPTDRVKIEGRIKLDQFEKPKIVLTYKPEDFRDMVGSNISVIVNLKP